MKSQPRFVFASSAARKIIRAIFALAVISGMVFCATSVAQTTSGVTGAVADSSGSLVPGVAVKLERVSTGFSKETTTNDDGGFEFRSLQPGSGYRLTFQKENFKTVTLDNITLAVTEVATVNVTLELGSISQSVEVSSDSVATLNTTDAAIGNDIDTRRVAELPSIFRTNAAALLTLAPGVVATSDNGSESDSQEGSVTGSRADQGNITLDGLDVNDETIGQAFSAVGSAPIDSIQEIHTNVGQPNADFGRSSGGQISLVTKSGTNNFHGSLHEYNRNAAFAANDFFNNKNGIEQPPLNRNQFGGSLGGPIWRNRAFFFFNYEGRRDNLSAQIQQIVPNDTFRSGQLNYIDANGNVKTTTTAQLMAIDPLGQGANQNFLDFINSRYPVGNDPALSDGLNTTGFIFNTPIRRVENIYTGRVDFDLTSKHKLFARAQFDRFNDDDDANVLPQFPSDPIPQESIINHSRSWVVGETWNISNNLINQFFGGLTRQVLDFPVHFAPSAPDLPSFSLITSPFADIRGQNRNVSVPEIRDDLTYIRGKHAFSFGTDLKFIRVKTANQSDINFVSVGLGGLLTSLDDSTRPADISSDPAAQNEWDRAFPLLLGRFAQTNSFLSYDHDGNVLPQYSFPRRNFHYNEYEFYGQDSWRIRPSLTLTFGLRWQYHSVPFEANGFQAVPNQNIDTIFPVRVNAALQGISGPDAAPLVSYNLGGPANHGPDYYKPDYHDFSPRVGIAYSPSFTSGVLGSVFGDRKTTIRAGGAIVYDRVLSTLSFELDEQTFVFDSNPIVNYGGADPVTSLATSPRFVALNQQPPLPDAPAVRPLPVTPNVDNNGLPNGLMNGGFPGFLQFDKNFETPYSYTFSAGVQRELPGKYVVEVNYFGRLGRKLVAVGDAAQTLNFKDAASGQFLKDAFAQLQTQVQQGLTITPQPWFEDQLPAAGFACAPHCTEIVGSFLSNFVAVGDLSSTILLLDINGVLNPNVALYEQTGANGFIGNYSSSSYNALLASVRKRYSNNLQIDFDYSYSHSIDNQSNILNSTNQFTFNGQSLVCDLTNLRTCRADSLFDARHIISANYVIDLPFGRGQHFLHDAHGLVNAVLGGWSTSGILSYRTGFPFNTHTGTFPIDFTQDAPAVFNGDRSAVRQHIHTDPDTGNIQFFADQGTALGAFSFPFGGGTGNRNPIHGPSFANLDVAAYKSFVMPWSERHKLQLRAEAFNLVNHTNFAAPGTGSVTNSNNILLNPDAFGVINSTAGNPRILQFSIRYDF